MSIAEKILRAKADYDAVYEAGKAAGGGAEPVELVIEPDYIEANQRFSYETYNRVEDENCDVYEYHIYNMFGATVKVKTAMPDDSLNIYNDYEHELSYDTLENEFEVPITTNDGFEIWLSCVRADGPPQVVVSFKGIVVEKEPDYTACFDGSASGEYVDADLTTVRFGGFAGTNFTKISLPNCTELKESRNFAACPNLEIVELPEVTTVYGLDYTFYISTKLKSVSFPKLEYAPNGTGACFQRCTSLERVEFPKLSGTTISNFTFRQCSNLKVIIIGGSTLCPLGNTNAFNDCPYAIIYVPDNLVDTYKNATNWISLASRIKGLSEL
jgi:hypothetical protein